MITIKVKKSNKCNGEYSLFLSFPYDYNIVNIMRNQIIRYWHADTKEWELPFKSFTDLQQQLKDYRLNIVDTQNLLSKLTLERQ